jgi:riboflavin biosynthesis pyrimidine reductase
LAAAFAAADQVDGVRTFVAPLLLGGPAPDAPPTRREALAVASEQIGQDTLITARFKEW